jgi:hypothetical protein
VNLFDLMGANLSQLPNARHGINPVPGGHQPQHNMPLPVGQQDAAPVGSAAALARFGPVITQQLQAAYARYQQQQMQAAASARMAQQGQQVQGGIDAQTQALIDQQINPNNLNTQPPFPIYDYASGGGDSYMQAPPASY